MDEKLTCLYDSHVTLGARMSPFGGFLMPIQYSSIPDEHNAVRTAAGMFDVSHMGEVAVSGPDALRFVNHIFTNDVSTLAEGGILYGMMLREDGGTVDDLLVYREAGSESFFLVINASNIDKDVAWIKACAEGFDVVIDNQSEAWGEIAVQGPEAEKAVTGVLGFECASALTFYTFCNAADGKGERVIISRTGYTGEDGFEIYASISATREYWAKLLEAGVKPCGLGCRDTLRFEAGLPLYGDELSDEISPVMAGLGVFCKTEKTEFIGREAIAAQKAEGTAYKLVGVEVLDRAIPRAGYDVETPEGEVIGRVTTGYRSPSLGRSLCFALVQSAYSKLGTALQLRIHGKPYPAVVIKKRFYQTNYKK
ncbi:MAG: glycine cleavage system aminomethyltransferase GcvT [Bacteroidales bacterium]|nr:glycine cleavage system aminomethyltransferase GcvT [Candidatus Cryptobacteroides aphodequi]